MEINSLKHLFLCLLTVSSLSACLRDEPVGNGGDGIGNEENAEYETGLEGLSALCMNEAGDGLLVAEDNGHVFEFGLDGKKIKECSFPSPNDKRDWEGITKADDGTIYLCEERTREIYKLSPDHNSVTLVSQGPKEGSKENQGFEGIAAAHGVLYVANQSVPTRVYKFTISTGTWETAFDLDSKAFQSLSDITFDSSDETLWITDAKTQKLTQVKTDGTVLKSISLTFVAKPEGFCMDPAHNAFWFVCDQTAKLYKRNKLQ